MGDCWMQEGQHYECAEFGAGRSVVEAVQPESGWLYDQ
jgi:hypothetical protein